MSVSTPGIVSSSFPHIVDHILNTLCDNDPLAAVNLQTIGSTAVVTYSRVAVSTSFQSFSIGTIAVHPAPSIGFTEPVTNNTHPICHPLVIAALRSVKVLDALYMHPHRLLPPISDWLIGDLQMLRLAPGYLVQKEPPLPPSETLVIFHLGDKDEFHHAVTSDKLGQHLVIHGRLNDYFLGDFSFDQDLARDLKNVTVFYPFPPRDQRRRSALYDKIMDRAIVFIKKHFGHSGTRYLTFVSPDATSPKNGPLPNPAEPSWSYFHTRLQLEASQTLENVEFLTTEEYRQRVGDEAYNLHAYWGYRAGGLGGRRKQSG